MLKHLGASIEAIRKSYLSPIGKIDIAYFFLRISFISSSTARAS